MMAHFADPLVGINFDTGNTFIAGHDPVVEVEAHRERPRQHALAGGSEVAL
jgi:sugar phosphate isomerase/epimerase